MIRLRCCRRCCSIIVNFLLSRCIVLGSLPGRCCIIGMRREGPALHDTLRHQAIRDQGRLVLFSSLLRSFTGLCTINNAYILRS